MSFSAQLSERLSGVSFAYEAVGIRLRNDTSASRFALGTYGRSLSSQTFITIYRGREFTIGGDVQ